MSEDFPIFTNSTEQMKSKHALAPSLAKAIQNSAAEMVNVTSAALQEQFIERLSQLDQMITAAAAQLDGCSLDSVTVSLAVSAEGKIGIASIANAGSNVASVIQVVLKPKKHDISS